MIITSQRVSDMDKIVCNQLGLKQFDSDEIHIAAHLHDIGNIVRFHHERYDGKGYPGGLQGEIIFYIIGRK